jgi:YbbR domain-containing protein
MKMKTRMRKQSLKVISAFLAVFLWVYVLNSEKVKFEKTITIEYQLPRDMIFAERPVQEVVFAIEGPRAFVRTVAEREDKLIIDLNRANTRKQLNFTVDINPTQLNLPFGMTVERVSPRRLSIHLEKKASKIVPVKLHFLGDLPEKLSLGATHLNHPEVEVYGPRSVISRLQHVSTKPIDLESLVGLNDIPVEVAINDDRLSLHSGYDLRLSYELKAASANFELKNVPIKYLSTQRQISSKIKSVTVKLLVPEKILKNRSNVSSSVQVWADIPQGARGRVEVPLKVVLPPSMHLLQVSPNTVVVNIE